MATAVLVLCMLTATLLLSPSSGQQCACGTTGDNDVDFRDCISEDVLLDKIDGENSVVCQRYTTQSSGGFEDCLFESPETTPVISLNDFSDVQDNFTAYRLFSPNHQNTTCCYPPQIFCGYNVQCRPGELLYYRIVRSDLQTKDPDSGICNDQLTILRESHAERELITCGKNTTLEWEDRDLAAPANGEEFDRLQVKFYSSRECHNCGFFMFAFCINQANTYDQPGCVQNIPTFGKRDTESEASSMGNLWAHSRRRRHTFRSYPIVVPVGARMTYTKKTLKIFKKDRLWKLFRNIVVFQEYDTVFRFENNYGFSKLTYNGFGILWVGIRIAQYIEEGVLPKLKPTPGEEEVIDTILQDIVLTQPRFRDDILEPVTNPTDIPTDPTTTGKPTTNSTTDPTTDSTSTDPTDVPTTTEKPPFTKPTKRPSGTDRHKRQSAQQLDDDTCPTNPSKGANTCLFVGSQVGKRSTTSAIECAERAAQSCNGIIRTVGEYFFILNQQRS